MRENLSDHHRVFDTGNNLDVTTAFIAGLNSKFDRYDPGLQFERLYYPERESGNIH